MSNLAGPSTAGCPDESFAPSPVPFQQRITQDGFVANSNFNTVGAKLREKPYWQKHLQKCVAEKQRRRSYINYLIPQDKDWSEVGLSVYRVGVGMYHSSVVVDDIEWHYWEGVGVEPLMRYYDEAQGATVSVDHVSFVKFLPIDTLMLSPRSIAELCENLGDTAFSSKTYDILRCNCNHFTATVLRKLGSEEKMPMWVNRLACTADNLCTRFPIIREWIDSILNRKMVINRDSALNQEDSLEWLNQEEQSPPNRSLSFSVGPTFVPSSDDRRFAAENSRSGSTVAPKSADKSQLLTSRSTVSLLSRFGSISADLSYLATSRPLAGVMGSSSRL